MSTRKLAYADHTLESLKELAPPGKKHPHYWVAVHDMQINLPQLMIRELYAWWRIWLWNEEDGPPPEYKYSDFVKMSLKTALAHCTEKQLRWWYVVDSDTFERRVHSTISTWGGWGYGGMLTQKERKGRYVYIRPNWASVSSELRKLANDVNECALLTKHIRGLGIHRSYYARVTKEGMSVKDVAYYPCFNLVKAGYSGEVINGKAVPTQGYEYSEELEDRLIQFRIDGLPEGYDWGGLYKKLMEVEWALTLSYAAKGWIVGEYQGRVPRTSPFRSGLLWALNGVFSPSYSLTECIGGVPAFTSQ